MRIPNVKAPMQPSPSSLRRPPGVRSILAVALVLAGVLASSSSRSVAATSTTSVVPVVACPTEFGAAVSTDRAKIPDVATVDLSSMAARSVAVYTDWAQQQTVLGPRGWHCHALYGADGNGGITVYAPRESLHYDGVYLANSMSLQAISVDWSLACVECILSQACPFFSRGGALYDELGAMGGAAVCERPKGEVVVKAGSTLVSFLDPSGVTGSADPSGGRLAALGIVYWGGPPKAKGGHTGTHGSVIVTCTLPLRESRICNESFSYFERHDDGKLAS